jgi:vitamin K-dependent gamma-carboxylase
VTTTDVASSLRGFAKRLVAPHDVAALVFFRVALGVLVTISSSRFLAYGWVDEYFVQPRSFLKYWGFGWVPALPAPWMHGVFALSAILGVALALGAFHRIVAPLIFLLFTYVQLVDVTNWLNHYYLVSLLLLLASFMPLGRAWSIDAWRRPETRLTAFPAWCTYLLRLQIGVVYFYAGIAKLSSDWLLHAQPLNIWLSSRTDTPIAGAIFDERFTAYAFSWGGFLFDTSIVFFLLRARTRPFAYAVLVVFHAIVGVLFPIGMFPWIMIVSALVFFSPSWPRRFLRRQAAEVLPIPAFALPSRPWRFVALAYCAFQILFPLRHRLYGGNVNWHEQGMRFSWKVMVREKNGSVTYIASSKKEGRTVHVSPRRYLDHRQERELSGQPDLVLQLAHRIRDDFKKRGWDDVEVRAEAVVSLNGRPAAAMIDPNVDLARIDDGFAKASWILPEPEGPPIHLRPIWNARVASR